MYSTEHSTESPARPTPVDLLLAPVVGQVGVIGTETRQARGSNPPTDTPKYALWAGHVPGACGAYWVPALYDGDAVRRILDSGNDYLIDKMRDYRTGLKDSDVVVALAISGECDDGTREEQEDRLAELEVATGLRPGLLVLSGDTDPAAIARAGVDPAHVRPGKSLHSYLLLDTPFDLRTQAARSVREEAADAYCVAIGGDPAATNSGRLMRLPNAVGLCDGWNHTWHGVRLQTCIRAEGVRYPFSVILDKLTPYVRDRWGVTVPEGIQALRDAGRLRKRYESGGSVELLDLANRLVESRGGDARAVEDARWELDGFSPSTTTSSPAAASVMPGHTTTPDTVLQTPRGPQSVRALAAACQPGAKPPACSCPVHGGHPDAAYLYVKRGVPHIKCWSCGVLTVALDPALPTRLVDLGDVDSIVGGAADGRPAASVGGDDPRWGIEFAGLPPDDSEAPDGPEADAYPRDPEDVAGHERLMAWKDYSAPLRARVEAKLDAADKYTREVVQAAARVIAAGRALTKSFADHLRAQGVTRRGAHCGGRHQALTHVANGELRVASRDCTSVSCALCGPRILARKAAAIVGMPYVEGGRIVGAALGDRPAFEITIPASKLGAWTKSFRRGSKEARSEMSDFAPGYFILNTGAKSDIWGSPPDFGSHLYVVFDPKDGSDLTVLSSLPVRLRGTRMPIALGQDADALLARAADLIEDTYKSDGDPVAPKVRGKVSSPHGLYLRPDTLYVMAHPSGWAVEADDLAVSPKRAKELLEAEGLQVRGSHQAEDGLLDSVSTSARDCPEILVPERRTALLALLGGTASIQCGTQTATQAAASLLATIATSANQAELGKIVEELLG